MKVALCFYGLVGGITGKNGKGKSLDPKIAYELYKENILDQNNQVDIFIHSWSYDFKDRLIALYEPKKACIEKQIDFQTKARGFQNKFPSIAAKIKLIFYKIFNNNAYLEFIDLKEKELFRACSRWYSSKKSLDLKKEYEKENGFKYDAVMITRLDVGFFTNLQFNNYDIQYFYAPYRNDAPSKENNFTANKKNHFKGSQFQDLWFFSNSDNMDKFSLLYDYIENYGVSPHVSSREHVDVFIGKEKVRYTMYRWFDYEMIRRKLFDSNDSD
ncbi:hypothetical protein N9400_02585 [Candidatus Thioglobus sp.]|nr:hypothetical protein [Candidatus Thioglobus sp.]